MHIQNFIETTIFAQRYKTELEKMIFSVCAPPLNGCTLFGPPDARAIFLYNDQLCNGTCSLTGGGGGGAHNVLEGANGKYPKRYVQRSTCHKIK